MTIEEAAKRVVHDYIIHRRTRLVDVKHIAASLAWLYPDLTAEDAEQHAARAVTLLHARRQREEEAV